MSTLFTTDGKLMPIPYSFEERGLPPGPPQLYVPMYRNMPAFMRRLGRYFYSTAETATASTITLDLNNTSNYATITSIDGFMDIGKAKNVLKEEVINSNKSDLYVPANVYTDANEITINFFVSDAFFPDSLQQVNPPTYWHINVVRWYENFVKMFIGKKIWIKSVQHGYYNQFICMKDVKPIKEKLGHKRSERSNFIHGKIILERIYTHDFRMSYGLIWENADKIKVFDVVSSNMVEIAILNNELFVGNQAMPDGTFGLANGRTIIIQNNVITQIIQPPPIIP